MTNTNRADRIEQLYKTLKKYYKPTAIATDRPVLDLMLYACCLEDSKFEAADEAFAKLQQTYFDWNEVRVTTVAELGEVMSSLPNPLAAAKRIKMSLQSLFESKYTFEIDELRKANLGKTVAEMEAWVGVTKFVVAFVTQNALGGHAIPIDESTMSVMKLFEIVTPSEAEKGIVPGLERTIAKTKGPEFATLLHQFAADFNSNSKSATALSVFKDLGVNPKPKVVPPPLPPKKVEPVKVVPVAKTATGKSAPEPTTTKKGLVPMKPEPSKTPADKSSKAIPDKGTDSKKMVANIPVAKQSEKKPESKKPETKKLEPTKPDTKSPSKGLEKIVKKQVLPPKPATKTPPPKAAPVKKGVPSKPTMDPKKNMKKGVSDPKSGNAMNKSNNSKSKTSSLKITKKKPK